MSGLDIATDIVTIVGMSLITITLLAFYILVYGAWRKVNKAMDALQAKADIFRDLPFIGWRMFQAVRHR